MKSKQGLEGMIEGGLLKPIHENEALALTFSVTQVRSRHCFVRRVIHNVGCLVCWWEVQWYHWWCSAGASRWCRCLGISAHGREKHAQEVEGGHLVREAQAVVGVLSGEVLETRRRRTTNS